MANQDLAVGLFFTGIGLWYLFRPRLEYFYQVGVFQREDGRSVPRSGRSAGSGPR